MFCNCGTKIIFPENIIEKIICRRCKEEIKIENFPSIRTKKTFIIKKEENIENVVTGAKIKIECPNCQNKEMIYNTAQLRSADEGQTVFYKCEACNYKETVQS